MELDRDDEESEEPTTKRQKLSAPKTEQKEESDDDYIEPQVTCIKSKSRSKGSKKEHSKKRKSTKPKKKKKTAKKSNSKSPSNEGSLIDNLKAKHLELQQSGYRCVVGVDEAGRGPLAGPVVIAAAFVPIDVRIAGITDSKKINEEEEREKLYAEIMATPSIKYSVTVLDHQVIDEYNILEASMMGMRECVQKLNDSLVAQGEKGVDYALADGNRDPRFEHPKGLQYEYIIKGDSKVYCIGAASIIAKVRRDRLMEEYHDKYPIYNFAQNKGYPTPQHKALVISKGPCDIHRKSFRPVKDWYQRHQPEIHEKWEALKKQRAEERKERLGKGKKTKKMESKGKKKKGKKADKKKKGNKKHGKEQTMITAFLFPDEVEEEQKDLEEDEDTVGGH